MSKELTPLEVSEQLKDFVLEFVKNGLDRRFVIGSFFIIEDQLKALKIIKSKKVNVRAFLKCCHRVDGLLIYNNQCYNENEKESKELTQEEYELLKEVLL